MSTSSTRAFENGPVGDDVTVSVSEAMRWAGEICEVYPKNQLCRLPCKWRHNFWVHVLDSAGCGEAVNTWSRRSSGGCMYLATLFVPLCRSLRLPLHLEFCFQSFFSFIFPPVTLVFFLPCDITRSSRFVLTVTWAYRNWIIMSHAIYDRRCAPQKQDGRLQQKD